MVSIKSPNGNPLFQVLGRHELISKDLILAPSVNSEGAFYCMIFNSLLGFLSNSYGLLVDFLDQLYNLLCLGLTKHT